MPRYGRYLFKRKGSQNWWLRLQPPRGTQNPKIERSLGTPDLREAELLAADEIHTHRKIVMLEGWTRKGEKLHAPTLSASPGTIEKLEGGRTLFANAKTIKIFDADGGEIDEYDNPFVQQLILDHDDLKTEMGPKPRKTASSDFIEFWITNGNQSLYIANEARSVWADLKSISGRKTINECTRDDARKLVEALRNKGNKGNTIRKKVSHLCAAANVAIQEGMLKTTNPFTNIRIENSDRTIREPLTDVEMALIGSNLFKLRPEDQMLWIWLATTGMRLGEAFQIANEKQERSVRYVVIGTKTDSSKRRVPLPSDVLKLFPDPINGPIFSDTAKAAGKRIRYFLRNLGISECPIRKTGSAAKVIHSLRHRAKDRLRAAGCPLEIQLELLGHERRTVSQGYGIGYPVVTLKQWIDTIEW